MLYYKSQPEDLTPIEDGVVFTIGSTEVCDIEVEIVDSTTESIVATKVIRGVESAEVDIAPYIVGAVQSLPSSSELCKLEDIAVAKYHIVACSDVWREPSNSVRVSCNRTRAEVNAIYSLMPLHREISYGEADDICFVATPDTTVEVWINTDSGQKKYMEKNTVSGVVQLHIATAEFNESVTKLEVEISVDQALCQVVTYTIVPAYSNSVRVAWITEYGVAERYTFPVTLSRGIVAQRKTLFTNRIAGQVVSSVNRKRITLQSRALTEDMAERLSTILCSPKVWLELDGEMVEARVLESEMLSYNFGKMASCSFTFEYGGEEVVL